MKDDLLGICPKNIIENKGSVIGQVLRMTQTVRYPLSSS